MTVLAHINVKDPRYAGGAKGDGTTDDRVAIQAALDAGKDIFLPVGTYRLGSALTLPDGVKVIGASPVSTILSPTAGFSDDCLIRASGRNDNNPNIYQKVTVKSLNLRAPTSSSGYSALDVTGFGESQFQTLWLEGSGPTVANMTAIRMSDQNPAATSHKSTFFNRFTNIATAGAGWRRSIYWEQIFGDCNHFWFESFNTYSRVGIEFGSFVGSAFGIFNHGYLVGDTLDLAVKGSIPPSLSFNHVDQELHSGDGLLLAPNYAVTTTALHNVHLTYPFIGDSGTSAASPIAPGSGTPDNFSSGAYIKVNNGTILAAGSNTFTYFFNSAPMTDSFFITPVSGYPNVALSFSGTISGSTFTLKVVAADGATLGSDLVLRVIAIQRSTLIG